MSQWKIIDRNRWDFEAEGDLIRKEAFSEQVDAEQLVEMLNEHWQHQQANAAKQQQAWKKTAQDSARVDFERKWFKEVTETLEKLERLAHQHRSSLLKLCEQIAKKTLSKLPDDHLVSALLQQSFEELIDTQHITVHLHPNHLKSLQAVERSLDGWLPGLEVKWVEDARLPQFAIQVDTLFGRIDFDAFNDLENSFQHLQSQDA